MTAQIPENLRYEGRNLALCSEPLDDYFTHAGIRPRFGFTHTALWRGYVGSWEIEGDRLYLVGLEGRLEDGAEVSLATFFPGAPQRVFADWYTGELTLPEGRQLAYVHRGFESAHERELVLQVVEGRVVDRQTVHHGAGG